MKKPLMELSVSVQLPLVGGGTFSWKILDLAALVQYYAANSPLYRSFLQHAYANHGLPFSLIIHEDEVTPGNIMVNRRKVHGWYCSFKEFGLHVRNENAWLHFASLQSDFVCRIDGGFSCVTKCLYQSIVQRSSILKAGVAVDIGGEHRLPLS